ncbi:MAG: sigma-70 family RNA polymerase sigma factor [Planctomycetota bacterium]
MPSLTHAGSPLAQARRGGAEPLTLGRRSVGVAANTTQTRTLAPAKPGRRRPGRTTLRPEERQTLRRVLTEKYEYVHHELFDLPAEASYDAVFVEPEPVPVPDVSWYHPLMDPGMADPATLARKAGKSDGSVLLTAAQERVIFTQFNYCRKQVCDARDRLLAAENAADQAARLTPAERGRVERELLDWYARADALRTQIADTNLALVLAMAKRSRIHPGDFADLIGEGNMALLRATDKFDVGRGFKFSTYACRAILKAFSRQGIKLSKHRSLFPVDFDPKLERSNHQAEKNREHENDCADEVRRIVALNRAELSDVERTVVAARFNVKPEPEIDLSDAPRFAVGTDDSLHGYELPASLRGRGPDAKPLTLEQVGKLIGVTKERVRQIQNKALDKIRHTLETEYLG